MWYKRFRDLLTVIGGNDRGVTMQIVYKMMDDAHCFGHSNTAYYAEESLELLLKEEGLWHGE